MRYTSSMKKEKILETIVKDFEELNEKLKNEGGTERDWGKHIALVDLLQKIKIYEVEE